MSAQGQYDPLPRAPPPPPKMEGFGSSDISTPLHYGSVNDGRMRMDSLEQKLRKQYWKTKQTFIQKMGKNQDEFVVAGDVDIDMKLEKAYHLRSTSVAILQAISKYSSRLKLLSREEEAMGRYLMTWSETEYTNAGEVMQNVGKMQENDSQARLGMLPSLARLHSECSVFQSTAIRDLNISIERLEKARTEYRAALLWMRDVSQKLHNPDYPNQLTRFREAQVAVKDSKVRFEKLKNDLSEKIDMVFASRCNLLSRSLPFYQQELLTFCDKSANAFHKILVDLRSHHHHQYKVKRLLEEIRDLESEETPITAEMERAEDDDEPLLDIGAELIGSSSQSPIGEDNVAMIQDESLMPPRESDPFSLERITDEAKVNDMLLGGSEAALQSLQSEVLQPSAAAVNGEDVKNEAQPNVEGPSQSAIDEIDNMLNFEESADKSSTELDKEDVLDEWNSFSAFMSQKEPENPHSGWEKEFMTSAPPPTGATSTRQDSLTSNLPVDTTPKVSPDQPTPQPDGKTGREAESLLDNSSSLLADELKLLGLDSLDLKEIPQQKLSSGLETLDPLFFQASQQQQQMSLSEASPSAPLAGPNQSMLPNPGLSMPPLMPQQPLVPPVFRSPLMSSQMPIIPQGLPSQTGGVAGKLTRGASPTKPVESKKVEGKGSAWMNVFAHLDPLANEKV